MPGIRTMFPMGISCLSADYYFSELTLYKSKLAYWPSTKALNNNYSLICCTRTHKSIALPFKSKIVIENKKNGEGCFMDLSLYIVPLSFVVRVHVMSISLPLKVNLWFNITYCERHNTKSLKIQKVFRIRISKKNKEQKGKKKKDKRANKTPQDQRSSKTNRRWILVLWKGKQFLLN